MRHRPLVRGVRARLLLAVLLAVGAALAGLTLAFNVVIAGTLSRDADALLRARAADALALLRTADGRLVVGEAPDEGAVDRQVWVFSNGQALESPQTRPAVAAAARSLAEGPARFLVVPDADTRLYSTPVIRSGKRLGTIVAGISLAPYEQTKRTALIGSLVLAGLLLLVVALAARWLLSSALRPVARMTEEAAAWSERDLDRRFGLGEPYDELTQLAATLDGLLDRLAASLRREQRFSAELSHELRTPLARIVAEAELALRRERQPSEYRSALETVIRSARQMTRTVETLVAAAQHEADPARRSTDAYEPAAKAAEACAGLAAERGVEIAVGEPAPPLRVGVSGDLVERILQPLVENACRYGRRSVRVSVARSPTKVVYSVEDDGPGIEPDERERIFEPGARGAAAADGADQGGAGLGLALARRLARSASGEVEADAAEAGARFVVTLPAG